MHKFRYLARKKESDMTTLEKKLGQLAVQSEPPKKVLVRLKPALHLQLKRVADHYGISFNDAAIVAIEHFIESVQIQKSGQQKK